MSDIFGQALRGFDYGRQIGQQNALAQAMQAGDTRAVMGIDPRLGAAMEDRARQREQEEQQAALAAIERNRDSILKGAQIFRAAKARNPNMPDEQVYTSILPALQQMGINIQGLPQPDDPQLPQYLQSIMAIADGLAPQKEGQLPSFIREADELGIPRSETAQLWRNQRNIVVINGVPHVMQAPGQGEPAEVLTDEEIEALERGGPQGSPPAGNF